MLFSIELERSFLLKYFNTIMHMWGSYRYISGEADEALHQTDSYVIIMDINKMAITNENKQEI